MTQPIKLISSEHIVYKQSAYKTYLPPYPKFVFTLMKEMERNGVCETGIVSDRKQRGTSINTDPCGWDEGQQLAVVQVRQCQFHPRKFNKVRKDYYLVGWNENGTFFAHAVDSPLRSSYATTSPEKCVEYTLSKIWGCKMTELCDIVRQGDLAFIPVRAIPEDAVKLELTEPLKLRDSHTLTGDVYRHGEDLYARRGAKLTHDKKEHAAIKAKYGFYRVALGYRAATWGFTAPTTD